MLGSGVFSFVLFSGLWFLLVCDLGLPSGEWNSSSVSASVAPLSEEVALRRAGREEEGRLEVEEEERSLSLSAGWSAADMREWGHRVGVVVACVVSLLAFALLLVLST